MPWWVAGYFGFYIAFSTWSLIDDYRSKQMDEFWASLVSDLLLLGPALAYWISMLHAFLRPILVVWFFVAVVVFACTAILALRKYVASDAELSSTEKVGVGLAGVGLAILVSSPIIVWGYRAALIGHVDA